MNKPGNEIDWDKLLTPLEGKDLSDGTAGPLNKDEEAMLLAAKEMSVRLKEGGVEGKFSADKGWQRFDTARSDRQGATVVKVTWWKSFYKISAAAAAAVIVITAGVWMSKQHRKAIKQPVVLMAKADLKPSNHVQLLLSNGKKVTPTDESQLLRDSLGIQIQVTSISIVYEANNGQAGISAMDTLVVPKGNQIKVTLADGTGIWVNAASKLIYPAAFNNDTREVSVEGEAFFDVAANPQKPFIVHTNNMQVKVLGTSFNVNTYNTVIQTTLTSGKVIATAATETVMLSPGEQANYSNNSGSLNKRQVDTRAFTAWKDGYLYFDDATLADIANSLGRGFDYDFQFENTALEKLTFTLDMRKPATLQEVLNQISRTIGNIKFRVQGRTVYVSNQ
ncbi:FecR family protein [Chitinophaga niastensis]|uniref:FecR family protein n=1 Tax=Chitinophaga niastensis TaxID=536980 RepID=A0A2P8HK01_CHINA|nr:FecR family protein [Chitinophaga niastensis]PSL46546.1 FecR family protein [Chitinophaga niastensis]